MSTATCVTHRAEQKRTGMTIDQVQRFLDDCARAGLPLDSKVEATVGFRAQITTLTAKGTDQ